MVGKILARGLFAGLLAALLAFTFARLAGEPLVDRAIAFESNHAAHGHRHESAPQGAVEDEAVSRSTQAGLGLLSGVLVYGTALGGLFALAYAFAQGRLARLRPRALALVLALGAFVVLALVPALKYPANPPAVGNAQTIGLRTALFFGMLALSLCAALCGVVARRHALARGDAWYATLVGIAVYIGVVGLAQSLLPTIDEVPHDFPAALLWHFRLNALGIQAILWLAIGLVFGCLSERATQAPRPARG